MTYQKIFFSHQSVKKTSDCLIFSIFTPVTSDEVKKGILNFDESKAIMQYTS